MDHQRSRQFFVRDGTAWGKVETIWGGLAIMGGLITDLEANFLITCRFLVAFLVVSKKKRIFAAEVLNIEGIDYEKYE